MAGVSRQRVEQLAARADREARAATQLRQRLQTQVERGLATPEALVWSFAVGLLWNARQRRHSPLRLVIGSLLTLTRIWQRLSKPIAANKAP